MERHACLRGPAKQTGGQARTTTNRPDSIRHRICDLEHEAPHGATTSGQRSLLSARPLHVPGTRRRISRESVLTSRPPGAKMPSLAARGEGFRTSRSLRLCDFAALREAGRFRGRKAEDVMRHSESGESIVAEIGPHALRQEQPPCLHHPLIKDPNPRTVPSRAAVFRAGKAARPRAPMAHHSQCPEIPGHPWVRTGSSGAPPARPRVASPAPCRTTGEGGEKVVLWPRTPPPENPSTDSRRGY